MLSSWCLITKLKGTLGLETNELEARKCHVKESVFKEPPIPVAWDQGPGVPLSLHKS